MVNVTADVWAHADADPERVAVRSPRLVTFGGLRATNRVVAAALRAHGMQPLDRVLFLAPSIPQFPEVYYGLHAAGVTVLTMNTMSTTSEIGYVLDDSGATLVIAWHSCSANAVEAASARGIPLWQLVADEDVATQLARLAQVRWSPGSDRVDFLQGGDEATDGDKPAYDHGPQDTVLILYTSGTTGRPKGAELTAANLVDTAASFVPVLDLTSSDRWGTALPLFHVFGQCVCMNTALSNGVGMSLLSPFEPRAMLELMRADELTMLAGVPTMWNAMLQVDGFEASDFALLRLAASGGASLPVEVIRAFRDRFGCSILEGYGLTESTGAATFNDLHREQRVGTVGPALPGTRLQVRDPEGAVLAPGAAGEVFVKGPTIMKGYWNRPEATESDLRDGWLRTGDIGVLDEDGYLSIVDRVKDLIIRGGYNVYPREVEEVLYEHPEIVEVAVVGVPDTHYGEEIAAVVVVTAGSGLDGDAIRRWAKERLSAYKVPRLFSFVDSLPKGPTGKILKRAIDRDPLRASAAPDGSAR